MIATYNTNVGDVLMLITANDKGEKVNFERKGKVARVFIEETGATVAWNIFASTFTDRLVRKWSSRLII
ncbi:hypothetical protein ICE98_01611 [Lactococcus lactis]|nr:hypothetical protein [Lactococcus lactis]